MIDVRKMLEEIDNISRDVPQQILKTKRGLGRLVAEYKTLTTQEENWG